MREGRGYHSVGRRDLLLGTGILLAGCRGSRTARSPQRPEPRWGVQSGDIDTDEAVVWCRSDRSARMVVEWSRTPGFETPVRILGPLATAETDFTAKVRIAGLTA